MTSKLTREWLQHQISEIEVAGITDSNTLAAFKLALAAMGSEPVGEFYEDGPLNWYQISDGDRVPAHRRIPLYRHAQQPVVQPAVIPEWTNEQCLVSDRWIPVSERMPEDGECVVIVDSHHGCFYGGAVALYRAPHFHLMDGLEARNYDGEAVVSIAFETTHWMPLPDAPQEVNHG